MHSELSGAKPEVRFNSTQWSVVLRASDMTSEDGKEALSQLILRYWYPLYAFSRRKGNNEHDAQDITQGFFLHLMESRGTFGSLSPTKGRFRSYLLTAFKNYMANEYRASKSVRRGGLVTVCHLDTLEFEKRYREEPAVAETADLFFERSWIESLLANTRRLLRRDYELAGRIQLYELLEPHLLQQEGAIPRNEICEKLGMSAAAINMSLHRMRQRYGETLRQEVAVTVDDPKDVDDELRSLLALVGSAQ